MPATPSSPASAASSSADSTSRSGFADRRRRIAGQVNVADAGAPRADAGGVGRRYVELTNLDQPLFEDAGVAKRQLVDYLEAVQDRIIPCFGTARCR